MWRSLVAHTHGVRGVAGSNPVIPTNMTNFALVSFFVPFSIMKTRYFSYFLFFQVLFACGQANVKISTPDHTNYTIEVIVPNLEIPWGMAFLPDNSLLITEKEGQLIHFQNGKKTIIQNVPNTYVRGQGGLMGIAIHPNFDDNNLIYFTQSSSIDSDEPGGNTALYSAVLQDNALQDISLLYKAKPNTKKGLHFGSRVVFDNDGYLYFTIGDRGNRDVNPQDLSRDGGKVYRLMDNGEIPSNNPFVDDTSAKPAVYSYGHRNPQGMTKHPVTGDIWTHEHGPRGGDEINIIKSGKNYGWPKITYGKNYTGTTITKDKELPGMEQPLYYWIPSIAPSGMAFVYNSAYEDWNGSLVVGSLKFNYLERLTLDNNRIIKREKIANEIGRVRDVVLGPDGFLYLAVENKGICKIVPNQ
jgi:glucose/arabinose dehydrogenase